VSDFSFAKALFRKAASITAAYTLILQIFLTGIVATQMAVADQSDPFAICYGTPASSSGDHGKTSSHISHASCLACAFVAFASPLAGSGAAVVFRVSADAAYAPAAPLTVATRRHTPRSSQGPPQYA
jgi:hypothetical protein